MNNRPYIDGKLKDIFVPLINAGFQAVISYLDDRKESQIYQIIRQDEHQTTVLLLHRAFTLYEIVLVKGALDDQQMIVAPFDEKTYLELDDPLLDDVKRHVRLFSWKSASKELERIKTIVMELVS